MTSKALQALQLPNSVIGALSTSARNLPKFRLVNPEIASRKKQRAQEGLMLSFADPEMEKAAQGHRIPWDVHD